MQKEAKSPWDEMLESAAETTPLTTPDLRRMLYDFARSHGPTRPEAVVAVKHLLSRGSAALPPGQQDDASPMVMAGREGHTELVAAMVEAGVSTEERNSAGYTAMHWAAHYRHAKTVAALIAAGADVNARTDSDNTPLLNAAGSVDAETVKLLIQNGADICARNSFGHDIYYEVMHSSMMEAYKYKDAVLNVIKTESEKQEALRIAREEEAARLAAAHKAWVAEGMPVAVKSMNTLRFKK
jgi:hypothetical protein